MAAIDVLHGDTQGVSQHSLASTSSPAVSQAYTMYKQMYISVLNHLIQQQWFKYFCKIHEPCFRMNNMTTKMDFVIVCHFILREDLCMQ